MIIDINEVKYIDYVNILNEIERCILDAKHIDNKSWNDIAKLVGYSRRYVISIYNGAVEKLCK